MEHWKRPQCSNCNLQPAHGGKFRWLEGVISILYASLHHCNQHIVHADFVNCNQRTTFFALLLIINLSFIDFLAVIRISHVSRLCYYNWFLSMIFALMRWCNLQIVHFVRFCNQRLKIVEEESEERETSKKVWVKFHGCLPWKEVDTLKGSTLNIQLPVIAVTFYPAYHQGAWMHVCLHLLTEYGRWKKSALLTFSKPAVISAFVLTNNVLAELARLFKANVMDATIF